MRFFSSVHRVTTTPFSAHQNFFHVFRFNHAMGDSTISVSLEGTKQISERKKAQLAGARDRGLHLRRVKQKEKLEKKLDEL